MTHYVRQRLRGIWLSLAPALLLLLAAPAFPAGGLALAPEPACRLLKEEGLQARGSYREASKGRYRCSSFHKNLNAGGAVPHDLLFFAEGNAETVDRLGLELRIRSREDVQRALRILADTAEKLAQRGISQSLSPEVRNTILAGTDGRWMLGANVLQLERDAFTAAGFELKFTIE